VPGLSPAAVLQAESTTQSALSLSCATSLAVSNPSSSSLRLDIEMIAAKGLSGL